MLRWKLGLALGVMLCVAAAGGLLAQDEAPAPVERFHLRAEVKLHFRDTKSAAFIDPFPFPPSFLPPGQSNFVMTPPATGSSFELSTVNLIGDANLAPLVQGRVEVRFLDLYNRNPTSSDDRIQVHEAWLRFGKQVEGFEAPPQANTFYVLVGKAPRFSRQRTRQLESWGLWGTAVARFEEVQVEVGGTVGPHLYWRAQTGSGNPVFFRDPNALAGDNGTPERQPNNVHPIYGSGFPILYDTKSTDLNGSGKVQFGVGLGARFVDANGDGLDALAWAFERKMADAVDMRGTTYLGDIKLLQGPFFLFPLPIHGDRKREWGVNVDYRHAAWTVFGQGVDQSIAGLRRSGVEVEAGWRTEIPGILVGETPIFRWVQPTVRYSMIDNHFKAPASYPAPSVAWDWQKIDAGVRVGIMPGIDVTAEYAFNSVDTNPGHLHPNELLITLRAAY